MKKAVAWGFMLAGLLGTANAAYAQYPQITPEAQAKYKEMITKAYAHADSAWAKALPIVMKEAKEGRPYVPWASRPCDLPQAKIPAFPGAEGGCPNTSLL